MSRWWVRVLLVLAGIAGVVLLLDWLVETDREKIGKLVETCRAAALAGDVDAVMSQVDPAYQHAGRDFAALRERVARGLAELKAEKVLVLDPRLALHEDDTARLELVVRVFRGQAAYPPVLDFGVSLGLVKKGKRWWISTVDEAE